MTISLFTWNESMRTGITSLDDQHKQLFQKFNEFSSIINMEDTIEMRLAAGEVLNFLQFYIIWHFKQEEAYMEKYHCPAGDENKDGHARFIAEFGNLYERWQTGKMDMEIVRETHTRLANWIAEHISQVDTRLLPYVQDAKKTG